MYYAYFGCGPADNRKHRVVPVLPWLGVMWWGMASGQLAVARGWMRPPAKASKRNAATPLSWVGRWSLSWYMVHQPVLIGVLTVASTLR